jgi:hypothetical protein
VTLLSFHRVLLRVWNWIDAKLHDLIPVSYSKCNSSLSLCCSAISYPVCWWMCICLFGVILVLVEGPYRSQDTSYKILEFTVRTTAVSIPLPPASSFRIVQLCWICTLFFICKPETVHSYEINLHAFVDYLYVHVYLLSGTLSFHMVNDCIITA